jgi:hypothetical protein
VARPKPKRPSGAASLKKDGKPKRKISTQRIILYILSILLALSFALSFIGSGLGSSRTAGGVAPAANGGP